MKSSLFSLLNWVGFNIISIPAFCMTKAYLSIWGVILSRILRLLCVIETNDATMDRGMHLLKLHLTSSVIMGQLVFKFHVLWNCFLVVSCSANSGDVAGLSHVCKASEMCLTLFLLTLTKKIGILTES